MSQDKRKSNAQGTAQIPSMSGSSFPFLQSCKRKVRECNCCLGEGGGKALTSARTAPPLLCKGLDSCPCKSFLAARLTFGNIPFNLVAGGWSLPAAACVEPFVAELCILSFLPQRERRSSTIPPPRTAPSWNPLAEQVRHTRAIPLITPFCIKRRMLLIVLSPPRRRRTGMSTRNLNNIYIVHKMWWKALEHLWKPMWQFCGGHWARRALGPSLYGSSSFGCT